MGAAAAGPHVQWRGVGSWVGQPPREAERS